MENETKLKVKEILNSNGDLELASELVSNAIRENPSDYENYYLYGMIFFQRKEFALASLMFEAANAITENVDSLFMASISYLLQDKPKLTKLAIKQALYLDTQKTMKKLRSFVEENYANGLSQEEKYLMKIKLKALEESI